MTYRRIVVFGGRRVFLRGACCGEEDQGLQTKGRIEFLELFWFSKSTLDRENSRQGYHCEQHPRAVFMFWIRQMTSWGRVIDRHSNFQVPSCTTFLTISVFSWKLKGPREMGPMPSQLSCQNFVVSSFPMIHVLFCARTSYALPTLCQITRQFIILNRIAPRRCTMYTLKYCWSHII